ncbi:MAG: TolC family protein [Epsilonproteobacteria bacterium]|nr:TolC family protein [Campylobacterota bacterium]
MIQKKLILLFLIPLSVTTIMAETLTLQDSIQKTLQHYPDVKSSSLKVEQSQSSYKSAYADYLPQINLEANYNFLQTFAISQNGFFETLDDDAWSATASLKQKLWDFGKTSSKVSASKIDENIANLSLEDLKSLLAYKVKTLYKMMIVQSQAIKVREKDLQTKQAYYEQALALVKEGLKTKADASRFLSAVYNAQDALAGAKASYNKAKQTLCLYMGENISDDVELQTELLEEEKTVDKDVEKNIMQENYQLKIYEQNLEKNILLHKVSKANHYGSLDAVASYSYIDALNTYDSKVIGITFSMPLYSGGRLSAESQKTQIAAQIVSEQKIAKELALKDELETLLIDIRHYEKTIEAKKAQIKSAQQTQKVLDGRYKEGLSTYIEVLDAVSVVLGAKLGLLEAYYLKNIAIDKIIYLKGKK